MCEAAGESPGYFSSSPSLLSDESVSGNSPRISGLSTLGLDPLSSIFLIDLQHDSHSYLIWKQKMQSTSFHPKSFTVNRCIKENFSFEIGFTGWFKAMKSINFLYDSFSFFFCWLLEFWEYSEPIDDKSESDPFEVRPGEIMSGAFL